MIEIIITVLSILVVVLGYTTFNLLTKNEKAEDILFSYKQYMTQVSDVIEQSAKKLKEIDSRGSFESDDEIGWFFKKIQLIQDILDQYKLRNF
jgi:hypothetical protein